MSVHFGSIILDRLYVKSPPALLASAQREKENAEEWQWGGSGQERQACYITACKWVSRLTSRLELGNLRFNFASATQKSKVDGRGVRQVLACVQRGDGSERLGSVEGNLVLPRLRLSSLSAAAKSLGYSPFWEVITLWLWQPGRSFQVKSQSRLTRHRWTLLIRLQKWLSKWAHVDYFAVPAFRKSWNVA